MHLPHASIKINISGAHFVARSRAATRVAILLRRVGGNAPANILF
jgi:hypothetical protein